MIRYIITPHAKKRMRERIISEQLIRDALREPTRMLYDTKERILIKKLYKKNGRDRLLLIAGEMSEKTLEIITVIDTSKVRKYL